MYNEENRRDCGRKYGGANDNLEKEHICCAISNNNDIQVSSKKAWLADRFEEGLVFLKLVNT